MMKLVKCFISNESGATAIEYGLIAAGIALAAVTALEMAGTVTSALFGKAVANLTAAGH